MGGRLGGGRRYRLPGLALAVAIAALSAPSSPAVTVNVTVTVAAAAGGTVTGGPIACPPACTATVPLGTELRLAATPAAGNHLVRWEGACAGTGPSCDSVVDDAASIAAVFAPGATPPLPATALLRVTRGGEGTVVSEPEGTIECPSRCAVAHSGGGTVTLRAVPDAGWSFAGWSGECTGTGECAVDTAAGRSVGATFTQPSIGGSASQLTIVNVDPDGDGDGGGADGQGHVDFTFVDASGEQQSASCGSSSCPARVLNGTTIVLTAVPTGTGSRFEGWTGDCVGAALTCRLPVTGNVAAVAAFATGPSVTANGLNVTRAGGGRVESTPPGIRCGAGNECAAAYDRQTRVQLRAAADGGFVFVGWGDDCTGTAGCTLRMDATRSVTARFRRVRDAVLVVKEGSGAGTVASTPPGIACGSGADCESTFPRGSTVTLRAEAAARSRFVRWSGVCRGGGECRVEVSGRTTVTADFDRCATGALATFGARFRRDPRRVLVGFRLVERASAVARLLRGNRPIATARSGPLAAGPHTLRVDVPRRARGGRYRVRLEVADPCGQRRLTRSVRLRANG